MRLDWMCGSEICPPSVHQDALPVWHLFVVRVSDRESFQQKLRDEGIATGIHYPVPLHLQPAYEHFKIPPGTLPVTEKVSAEVVSLPMYPELTNEQLEIIVNTITAANVLSPAAR